MALGIDTAFAELALPLGGVGAHTLCWPVCWMAGRGTWHGRKAPGTTKSALQNEAGTSK